MANRFLRLCPRFQVNDLKLALSFYGKLGFATDLNEESLAIVKGNEVALHIHHDPDAGPSRLVWWVEVSDVEDLYQKCVEAKREFGIRCSNNPTAKPWGFKEFHINDPFGNLIIFAEATHEPT